MNRNLKEVVTDAERERVTETEIVKKKTTGKERSQTSSATDSLEKIDNRTGKEAEDMWSSSIASSAAVSERVITDLADSAFSLNPQYSGDNGYQTTAHPESYSGNRTSVPLKVEGTLSFGRQLLEREAAEILTQTFLTNPNHK